jgi:hypothetical protein
MKLRRNGAAGIGVLNYPITAIQPPHEIRPRQLPTPCSEPEKLRRYLAAGGGILNYPIAATQLPHKIGFRTLSMLCVKGWQLAIVIEGWDPLQMYPGRPR